MTRIAIARDIADVLLVRARHRCCICPEHRRIANIHHIDQDPANNDPSNLIGLCAECHADAHTVSTMRRGLTESQLREYRIAWESICAQAAPSLPREIILTAYYVNLDRLAPIYQGIVGKPLAESAPYWFKGGAGTYDALWANKHNSLDWQQLLALRGFLDECVSHLAEVISPLDIALFEAGAADPRQWQGQLVTFAADFTGCDIPDQQQLLENGGELEGPPPTLRRESWPDQDDQIFETCMMLNPRFFYSDSAFTYLSEMGSWSGVGICGLLREAVGSGDGHLLRSQLLVTPLWIGRGVQVTLDAPMDDADDDDPQHLYTTQA